MKKFVCFLMVGLAFAVLQVATVAAQTGMPGGQCDPNPACVENCCGQCDPNPACVAGDPNAIPCCSNGDMNRGPNDHMRDPGCDPKLPHDQSGSCPDGFKSEADRASTAAELAALQQRNQTLMLEIEQYKNAENLIKKSEADRASTAAELTALQTGAQDRIAISQFINELTMGVGDRFQTHGGQPLSTEQINEFADIVRHRFMGSGNNYELMTEGEAERARGRAQERRERRQQQTSIIIEQRTACHEICYRQHNTSRSTCYTRAACLGCTRLCP